MDQFQDTIVNMDYQMESKIKDMAENWKKEDVIIQGVIQKVIFKMSYL